MTSPMLMIAAGVLALAPGIPQTQTAPTPAAPAPTAQAPTAPGQGQYNGTGWDHMNGPSATGQPGAECEDLIEEGEGAFPGHAAVNGHSAFGGSAGDVYAGSQPQNSRNNASSSQYDTACLHQAPDQDTNAD